MNSQYRVEVKLKDNFEQNIVSRIDIENREPIVDTDSVSIQSLIISLNNE